MGSRSFLPRCRPITEVGNADAFRSCRGRSNFLAMGFARRTVMFDPTPSSIKNSVVQADGDFESRLGFGDTGFADRARVQILGRRGPGAGSGVLQGSKTMPAKRAPTGGKGDDGGAPGGYVQVFLYRVPKANHDSFAATEEKLFAIFRRHGIVGSDLYVCREARIFKGFRDLRTALEAAPGEEVWVEIDRYRDQADSIRVIEGIGKDPEAGSLFGRILQLASPGVLCPQGNAERVQL